MCRCTCRIYSKKRKCWVKAITCLKSMLLLTHTTYTHTHALPTASLPWVVTTYSPSTIYSKGTFPLSLTKQMSLKFWISASVMEVLICISLSWDTTHFQLLLVSRELCVHILLLLGLEDFSLLISVHTLFIRETDALYYRLQRHVPSLPFNFWLYHADLIGFITICFWDLWMLSHS